MRQDDRWPARGPPDGRGQVSRNGVTVGSWNIHSARRREWNVGKGGTTLQREVERSSLPVENVISARITVGGSVYQDLVAVVGCCADGNYRLILQHPAKIRDELGVHRIEIDRFGTIAGVRVTNNR